MLGVNRRKFGQVPRERFHPSQTPKLLYLGGLRLLRSQGPLLRQFVVNGLIHAEMSAQGLKDFGHEREGPLLGGHPLDPRYKGKMADLMLLSRGAKKTCYLGGEEESLGCLSR